MSISSILPLTPVAATSAVETASNVTISHHATEQADALHTTEGGDSIVELSNFALLQNKQQLEVQKQIIATDNAQQNAIKHLQRWPGMGKKSLRELELLLARANLSLSTA